jgi:hypothetical protein
MTAAECLQRAEECIELADSASGLTKDKLIQIAAAWLSLAEDTLTPRFMPKFTATERN